MILLPPLMNPAQIPLSRPVPERMMLRHAQSSMGNPLIRLLRPKEQTRIQSEFA